MKSEIELPSGEITEIEFEYLKMEKHCFTCFSLSHEEDDCPQRGPGDLPAKDRKLGITQRMALERIEASKRRHDDKRGYKPPVPRHAPSRDDRRADKRTDHHFSEHRESQEVYRRSPTYSRRQAMSKEDKRPQTRPYHHSSAYRGNEKAFDRRSISHTHRSDVSRTSRGYRETSYSRQRHGLELVNTPEQSRSESFYSLHQQTPKEKPNGKSPAQGGFSGSDTFHHNHSRSSHTPPPAPPREPMTQADGYLNPESSKTRERRSALERVNAPDLRDQLQGRTLSNGDSGRLMEIEILYDGEIALEGPSITPLPAPENNELSLALVPASNRTPASQRREGIASIGSREKTRLALANVISLPVVVASPPAVTATTGAKRKSTRVVTRKKIARSPIPCLKLSKATTSRSLNPPRKRLCTEKSKKLPCNKAGPSNGSPAANRKEGPGGLALLWSDNIKMEILESSPNIIDAKGSNMGESFTHRS
ncbi:hypothetical protein Rs2_45329 [Raphanus sativus]|nr:hypothetical protein Rs2_45329 [Raphanus sativus]